MLRFPIAVTLGCLSYFRTSFKVAFPISFAKEFVSPYSEIFKFFTPLNLVPQLL